MRKLASIRKVSNIRPIEGKDRIEQLNVDGWNVIVRKDENFKEGDLCVYFEIDSLLPKTPTFLFMEDKKYVVKTMKMAGVRSEGLALPMSILPKGEYKFDQDVTALLGVRQYNQEIEEEVKLTLKDKLVSYLKQYKWFRKYFYGKKNTNRKDSYPVWIVKTDETRIQNIPNILEDRHTIWSGREKVDGSSATYGLRKTRFGSEYVVCSRNREVTYDTKGNVWNAISKKHNMEVVLEELFKLLHAENRIVVQGEIISSNIQGNKYLVKEPMFYVFNIVVDGKRIDLDEELLKVFGLEVAPEVFYGKLVDVEGRPFNVEQVLQLATYNSRLNPNTLAEGMVFRTFNEKRELVRSFKAVSPDFLIKYKE